MPLEPDAAFVTAIAEGTVKVAELYIITLTTGALRLGKVPSKNSKGADRYA